jgi:predicted O-methyltransferase YrrM
VRFIILVMRIAFRPFYGTIDAGQEISSKLAHPFFALTGLRPLASQHSYTEDQVIRKYAALAGNTLVEIGVAEGGSAVSMRDSMSANACLYLIDPFLSGRLPFSVTFLVAQKAINSVQNGCVKWIKDFSFSAIQKWDSSQAIDLLFIDGDHSEEGCFKDWEDWSPHVRVGGYVMFHDACVFPRGWPKESDGPVKVVDKLFRGQASIEQWKIIEEVNSIIVVQKQL